MCEAAISICMMHVAAVSMCMRLQSLSARGCGLYAHEHVLFCHVVYLRRTFGEVLTMDLIFISEYVWVGGGVNYGPFLYLSMCGLEGVLTMDLFFYI